MAKKKRTARKGATSAIPTLTGGSVINPSQWAKAAARFGGKLNPAQRRAIEKRFKSRKNPTPGWFDHCVSSVAASGSASDPRAVCGAMEKRFSHNPKHNPKIRNPRRSQAKPTMKHHVVKRGAKLPNPIEAAARRFEVTHGRPPDEIIEVIESERIHTVLPAYGRLEWLSILAIDGKTVVKLKDFRGAMLCENEDADRQPQLFVIGGDQSVPLKDFKLGSVVHECELLGAAFEVAYKTRKDHLGESGGAGERVTHVHDFGSKRGMDDDDPRKRDGSRLPMMIYDVRNKKLQFAGGSYDLPEVGIRG
jgi:hypothetical protein